MSAPEGRRRAASAVAASPVWPVLVLALLVAVAYAPSLSNELVYDDHEVIEAQPAPRSLADVAQLWAEPHFRGLPYYRPVVRTTLLVQKALHGDVAWPYHASNAALALAAAWLVWGLLRRAELGASPVAALFAAALVAVHPVTSSCVLPAASGRETLLPAVLAIAALWAHLRRGAAWRVAATVCFAGALFGKEASVVWLPLLVAADALGLGDDPPRRSAGRWMVRHAPYALVLVAYFAVRRALFAGGEWRLALRDDPAGPLLSFAYTLQTIVAPFFDLAYEPEVAVWSAPVRMGIAVALAAAIGWALGRAGRGAGARGGARGDAAGVGAGAGAGARDGARGDGAGAGEGAARRGAALFALWLVLAPLPTANVLVQEARFDERYVFLALPAACALAALALSSLDARTRRQALRAGAVLVALAAVTSVHRASFFRDDATFAAQWIRTSPATPEAHLTLALALAERGDVAGAEPAIREALRLKPDFAVAWGNLGVLLAQTGRGAEAREAFERAAAGALNDPEPLVNLGLLLAAEGRLDEAIARYDAALALDPRMAEAWNNRGTALARRGDRAEAERSFREALRLSPSYRAPRENLDRLQRLQGR